MGQVLTLVIHCTLEMKWGICEMPVEYIECVQLGMTETNQGRGLLFQTTLRGDVVEFRGQLCQTLMTGRGGRVPPRHPHQQIEECRTGLAEWRFQSSDLVDMQTDRLVEGRQTTLMVRRVDRKSVV